MYTLKNELLEALHIIFFKWWQVGTGLLATWVTAMFGEAILLFITPDLAKAWIPIAGSIATLLFTMIFLFRKKNKELRYMDEKHRQEMEQDKVSHLAGMYDTARKSGGIPDTMTLRDFITEFENINHPALPNQGHQ